MGVTRGRSFFTFVVAVALVVIASLALSIIGSPPSHGASTDLAYDEVTKFASGDSSPQPGNFSADYQAAVAAGQQLAAAENPQGHGFFSAIHNMINTAKAAQNMMKNGIASREFFLGDLRRTDDPGAQTANVERPDQRRLIKLDFAKKTYEIIDMNAMMPSERPAPPPPSSGNGPPPSPQPGSGDFTVTVTSSTLGPKTIEGVPTVGYSFSFKGTMSNATGSCHNGTFETSSVQYISSYPDPSERGKLANVKRPSFVQSPEMAAVPFGCTPRITRHASGGSQAPTGRLAMFTIVGIGGSTGTQGGGKFLTVIERGNVRTLGGGDKNLFDIPAGFTQVTASPTPAP